MALRLSNLQIALLLSVGLHAGLLTLRIADPEGFDRIFRDTPLEVVLVNSRGNEAPVKAQALAQANLAGGGEADFGRATSPLPPSRQPESGDSAELQRAQIAQLQEQQQQLLAQLRRALALLPPPDPQRDQSKPDAIEQAEKRRRLIQLLAEIEKRVNDENARPKKRYISPATREVVYAQYYDQLRRRIEARGTRDFPEHRGKKLYGELTLNIHVDLRGRVIETDIVASSGNAVLDRRAVAIVRAAGPFGPFSAAMRQGAEVLVITSRFRFTREDGLETTLSAQP
ncbi:TonB family protein [Paucibacter sp. O1-1]|nr:TonB family protein [Paucibacter sp. O1-1]MDA3828490.1 TonB family protein [Paucibacter sp. O1-1]